MPRITRPQVYRVVREMLPRERFGPDQLLLWLEDTQLRNERARRSHERRRSARCERRMDPPPEPVVVVLAKRANIEGMHPHRFRHSYAIDALRAGMPEQVLKIVGGWRKIPETYFRTLGEEDAIEFHRQVSPGDRLGKVASGRTTQQPRQGRKRGRL